MIIKERLEEALSQVRNQIAIDVRREDPTVNFIDSKRPTCVVHTTPN